MDEDTCIECGQPIGPCSDALEDDLFCSRDCEREDENFWGDEDED